MSKRSPWKTAASPPSGSPEFHRITVEAGTLLHRIHDRKYDATQFNPGYGNSRFAPFKIDGAFVPTAYAATSLECAAFETIFHDLEAAATFKVVAYSQLEKLQYSTFALRKTLYLSSLFSADLMKFGLERGQVIDTPRSGYPITRLWSEAVHQADPDTGGMVWVSRRYDQERALIMFGDRIPPDLLEEAASVPIVDDASTLARIFELGQRAGIEIVL